MHKRVAVSCLLFASVFGGVTGCPSMFVKTVKPPTAHGTWTGVLVPLTLYCEGSEITACGMRVEDGPNLFSKDDSMPSLPKGQRAVLVDRLWKLHEFSGLRLGSRARITGVMKIDFVYCRDEIPVAMGRDERAGHVFVLAVERVLSE